MHDSFLRKVKLSGAVVASLQGRQEFVLEVMNKGKPVIGHDKKTSIIKLVIAPLDSAEGEEELWDDEKDEWMVDLERDHVKVCSGA